MPKFENFPVVGGRVVYRDSRGCPHVALVTAVFGENNEHNDTLPCCNLVFVSGDENKKDIYGRQIDRDSSVVHKTLQNAHGNYWHFDCEAPNPVVEAST